MKSHGKNVEEYVHSLEANRQVIINNLRQQFVGNLPKGFVEIMSYGMPSYVVSLDLYPQGYHCKKGQPLPFMSFASQKNYISVYHMALYCDETLLQWFQNEWKKRCTKKLEIGKSCIRLKNFDDIPYELFGELARKISVAQWIAMYETRMESFGDNA